MSFDCLFLIQALVNRAVNKLETIHAQRRELSQNLFSLLEIYQISDKENKSVSSVYVYVLVYSFVCCVFICLLGAKVGKKRLLGKKKATNLQNTVINAVAFGRILLFLRRKT